MTESRNIPPPRQRPDKGRRVTEAILVVIVIAIAYFVARRIPPTTPRGTASQDAVAEPRKAGRQLAAPEPPPRDTGCPYAGNRPGPTPPVPAPSATRRDTVPTNAIQQVGAAGEDRETATRPRSDHPAAGAPLQGPVRILNISAHQVPTPIFETRANQAHGAPPRLWLAIVVEFETTSEWLDELTFNCWVMLGRTADNTQAVVLSRRIHCRDVEEGTHHITAFLHPNTFARFGPARRIAILATSQGQELTYATLAGDADRSWLATADASRLLSREETPFWLIDNDFLEFHDCRATVSGE